MPKPTINASKKRRGRPATGKGTQVVVRMQPTALERLDRWAAEQKVTSRPEAVRQLVDLGLRVDPDNPPLTEEELKRMRPLAEVAPTLVAAHRKRRND